MLVSVVLLQSGKNSQRNSSKPHRKMTSNIYRQTPCIFNSYGNRNGPRLFELHRPNFIFMSQGKNEKLLAANVRLETFGNAIREN